MKKILCVEDEAINAFVIKKMLQKKYEIMLVYNGLDCLNAVSKHSFDVILMDINLGDDDHNGIELVQQIKTLPTAKNTKYVAITAFALPEDKQKFLDQGFDDYVSKPIEETILDAILKKLV
ncbi:MAG: response regulator [Bacteroidetes bacterium]|nr:MAG: response regulator [Bacteroidota bacterium]TAG89625.1 MAG: response regulator [Bacteroidota bacterium]